MKNALITGGGSGIGRALAIALAKQNITVFIVGRRAEKLKETQQFSPERIHCIHADVSTEQGRNQIKESLNQHHLTYLIHNAAISSPLSTLDKITPVDWHHLLSINLDAPLFLTQALMPQLENPSRILNISSGLAHHALAGTGAYCVSKAGLFMLAKLWNVELENKNILAGSVQPGIVDTEMQQSIRNTNGFVNQQLFESFKSDDQLSPPETVAKAICWMLIHMDDNAFTSKDWSVDEIMPLMQ